MGPAEQHVTYRAADKIELVAMLSETLSEPHHGRSLTQETRHVGRRGATHERSKKRWLISLSL
jgi:hypothetical protein